MPEQIKNILDTLLDDSKYEEYGVVLYTYINRLEAIQTPNACETCKYFMSNHSFILGQYDHLNGCRVLVTPSSFYCNEYEQKDSK